MRFIYLVFVLFLASCFSSSKEKNKQEWKLFWGDEFNYTGLPDSAKWDYETGGNGWGNNELQYYTNASLNNAEVSNGTLKLKVLEQKIENRNYTSARLVTKGKAEFTYGKIEIKAKLPSGKGLWPAIWMLGANIGKVKWPDCGEIDIMEHVGYEQDSIFGTIHTKAYNHIIGTQKGKKNFIANPYNDFHLYSLEWSADHMNFLLDNKLFYSVENEHKSIAEWPFDSPFFLILNIAVGGNLGGKEGIDPSIFPATMEVDYVRVYKAENH